MIASFPMYDWPEVREATDTLQLACCVATSFQFGFIRARAVEALEHFDAGDYQKAVSELSIAVREDREDPDLYHLLGRCYEALGRPVDIAINHDAVALAVHKANHPGTTHLEADIWEVKPIEATGGRPVGLLWASPDCTHFSVAKGDVPRRQDIRSLAWAVVRWAKAVRPRVILLENVSSYVEYRDSTLSEADFIAAVLDEGTHELRVHADADQPRNIALPSFAIFAKGRADHVA